MTPAAIFLHAFCGGGGQWRVILRELFDALDGAAIPADLHVGLVGVHAEEAKTVVAQRGGNVIDARDTGWEHVTLEALHRFCLEDPADDRAVLYLHTKGAYDPRQGANEWRRSMAYHVVTHWRSCVGRLGGRYQLISDDEVISESHPVDAVGCHYMADSGGGPPSHFAGNFWWARSSFVASLPPLDHHSRYEAEFWLGRSPEPRTMLDVCPGGVSVTVDHDSGPCEHGQVVIHDDHVVAVA